MTMDFGFLASRPWANINEGGSHDTDRLLILLTSFLFTFHFLFLSYLSLLFLFFSFLLFFSWFLFVLLYASFFFLSSSNKIPVNSLLLDRSNGNIPFSSPRVSDGEHGMADGRGGRRRRGRRMRKRINVGRDTPHWHLHHWVAHLCITCLCWCIVGRLFLTINNN